MQIALSLLFCSIPRLAFRCCYEYNTIVVPFAPFLHKIVTSAATLRYFGLAVRAGNIIITYEYVRYFKEDQTLQLLRIVSGTVPYSSRVIECVCYIHTYFIILTNISYVPYGLHHAQQYTFKKSMGWMALCDAWLLQDQVLVGKPSTEFLL